MRYLTADIGSTYTKLTAIDAQQRRIVGTAQAFTTIDTNVMEGFQQALTMLEAKVGCWENAPLLVCSSAAGGLKMVALGLVPDLTAKAARTAASNAGAKVVKTYAYEISQEEADEIEAIAPDIVLLCGGTDGGNKEVILANAHRLCAIEGRFTTVVAGNKSAGDEIARIFTENKRDFRLVANVMPRFNELCIEPARDAIRQLFIEQIVNAKGLSELQTLAENDIIPTPLAVLQACELLSKGTAERTGMGDLLVVDIGGATTDVYSMAWGTPSQEGMLTKGLVEPWAKRTVEGDLGMRYSLSHVLEAVGADTIARRCGSSVERVAQYVAQCTATPATLPQPESEDERIEMALGHEAVALAVRRHCGKVEQVYTPLGLMHTLEGKDLMDVPLVVGVGGVLHHGRCAKELLRGAQFDLQHPTCAMPRHPRLALDGQYIFAALGLLSTVDPTLAYDLLEQDIYYL